MKGSPSGKKKKKAKAFLSIYFCHLLKHVLIIFISWFSKQEEVKNLVLC